jgi:enediyne biosynthesis protein E4
MTLSLPHNRWFIFATALVIPTTTTVNAADLSFSNQTTAAGVTAVHINLGVDSFLAGGAVGDFDRDGFQDIYYPTGGAQPDRLFINNGDGTFTDRAAEWGIAQLHLGTAAAVGDYDGDGWLDIFVTSFGTPGNAGPGKHRLYKNIGGASFVESAATAGVNFSSSAIADGWGAAFGDYDLDGDLDLAVAGWRSNNGNRLFRNNGNGTFTDVTSSAGMNAVTGIPGFAPRFADMDGDRYPELIWIADFGNSQYWINNTNGTFTNFTAQSGTSLGGTEMGQTVADFNHDGQFDFYVTTINANNLYINNGNHSYTNVANQAGVRITGWGWGTVGVDMNNDTLIDIAATTQSGRQYLFQNNSTNNGANLAFSEVAIAAGLVSSVSGRGLANFDYDNDGDQDLAIFPNSGPFQLFRNDHVDPDTHFLRVFLKTDNHPNLAPNGIGSTIKLTTGGETYLNRIDGGSNYLSQSELSAHYGLGPNTQATEIRVEWNDGQVTVVNNVAANQTITISPAGLVHGDSNGNGWITLNDVALALDCATIPIHQGSLIGCSLFDFDDDNDVDFADFGAFQRAFRVENGLLR